MVVAPTIAAVGLSFYSYGFPLVGKCLEIGVVQILLVVIFALVSLLKLLFVWMLAPSFAFLLEIRLHLSDHIRSKLTPF